ncbi:MAG: hypothetical protein AAGD18_14290 [Actinomycetota bacterium]
MRSDELEAQLDELGDWLEAAVGASLRPDQLGGAAVPTPPSRPRRWVIAATAAVALAIGAMGALAIDDFRDDPVEVIVPVSPAPSSTPTTTAPSTSTTASSTVPPTTVPVLDAATTVAVGRIVDEVLDGSEEAWSVVVLDTTTGRLLGRMGTDRLVVPSGSAIHMTHLAAAIESGIGVETVVDGRSPCGRDGTVENFGGGRGIEGRLDGQTHSASRCAMQRLAETIDPGAVLERAGLATTPDLIVDPPELEVAELAELARALTGDGRFRSESGVVELVSEATAVEVREVYEANTRGGTASRMFPDDRTPTAGITGTNTDLLHAIAILRDDRFVVAVALRDLDGWNDDRRPTGGGQTAEIARAVRDLLGQPD